MLNPLKGASKRVNKIVHKICGSLLSNPIELSLQNANAISFLFSTQNMFSMATNATFFLLLLLFIFFSVISTITTAQQATNSNIPIDSSLSPTNNTNTTASWLSQSGRFAFGFYPQDGGFIVGIWFAGIPQKTVVWTAPNLVKQTDANNFRLLLTTDEGLILQSTQGQDQDVRISEITSGSGVSYASMLDTGNMVLYNDNSTVIWQSFDTPTNTIVQGQRLSTGGSLFSSLSETDYSKGRFRLDMQNDGNLVAYPAERRSSTGGYASWSTGTPTAGDNVTVNLYGDGRLYLVNTNGTKIWDALPSDNSVPNRTMFYRLTLDINGISSLYSYNLQDKNGNWSVKWSAPNDKCAPLGLCGLNGYCTLLDQEPVCKCLPGFDSIDSDQPTLGCERVISIESCGSEESEQSQDTMNTLTKTIWEEDTYSVLTSTTEEECKNACLKDCHCEVVMFEIQSCRKQKLPLRYGRRDNEATATAFIKVRTQNTSTNNTNTEINVTPAATEDSKESKRRIKKLRRTILIASVSFGVGVLILLGILSFLIHKYRTLSRYKLLTQGNNGLNEAIRLRSFTYGELEEATDGFKEVVGRGSFGTVFKGALPHSKRLIAVKRLEKVVDEGEIEFQAEMGTIGRTHHRNLVHLFGYCHEGTNRLLVYEYMSNGSLADILFKSEESPGWNERVQIALQIARGILYLHEECETQIIHCDIKPQNILMDEYGYAKISDFGLAKLLKQDQTKTYTGMRGTRGYVALEWHRNLPITVKVDVYSYGIVLLEIICCRRRLNMELPNDEVVLVDWVFQCFDNDELAKLVTDDVEVVDMRRFERMIRVALWCIQDEPSMRPSMKKVVLMLEGTIDIPIPPGPTSFLSSI